MRLGGVPGCGEASGSSQHTRNEPAVLLLCPELRGRRRGVSQLPRVLTAGRQELARQPIRMGPGGQPCVPALEPL